MSTFFIMKLIGRLGVKLRYIDIVNEASTERSSPKAKRKPLQVQLVQATLQNSTKSHERGWTPAATPSPTLFLTTCLDDSKPYMILKALDESYKNHVRFAIIQASGGEQ